MKLYGKQLGVSCSPELIEDISVKISSYLRSSLKGFSIGKFSITLSEDHIQRMTRAIVHHESYKLSLEFESYVGLKVQSLDDIISEIAEDIFSIAKPKKQVF